MLRDLFNVFQNLPTLFFSLQKKVPVSVEDNENSNLSLLSLTTTVHFAFKWRDWRSKSVFKQQESCLMLIRSFKIIMITLINPWIWWNCHCKSSSFVLTQWIQLLIQLLIFDQITCEYNNTYIKNIWSICIHVISWSKKPHKVTLKWIEINGKKHFFMIYNVDEYYQT